jgi:hypothetical protein
MEVEERVGSSCPLMRWDAEVKVEVQSRQRNNSNVNSYAHGEPPKFCDLVVFAPFVCCASDFLSSSTSTLTFSYEPPFPTFTSSELV